jgi:hypothetical protein
MVLTSTAIMDDIIQLNQYFKSVVDMIPPSAYLGKNDFFHHSKADKKLSNSAKKALTKKRKFDPETMKTTSEIIQTQHENEAKKQKVSDPSIPLNPNSAKTLDQLQQCLKDKIAEQQSKRSSSKRTPEQQLVVTQRRREERARKKAKQQKIMQKAKQDRKAQLKQLKASAKQESADKPSQEENENPNKPSNAETTGDMDTTNDSKKKVLYSKIDFGNELEVELGEKKKAVPKARKIKQLLSEVEQKEKKLKELKETDPDEAAKMEEEDAWAKAMDKSEGTKVKDDAKLLKKTIKRRETLKQRSQKKWAERTAKVTEKMEKRQEIRKRNIANRKSGTKVVKKGGGQKKKGKKMK